MSRGRRKRPQRKPGRVVRKSDTKKQWFSFLIIMILFISVLAAIMIAIFSGPTS